MKPLKILLLSAVCIAIVLSPFALEGKDKPREKVYIPPQVKKVMEEAVKKGVVRNDISFSIVKNLFLPAQDQSFLILIFKAKNKDLMPLPFSEKERKKGIDFSKITSSKFNIFLWFYKLEGESPTPFKEQYVPVELNWESGVKPDDISTFTVCTILPGGKYLLSMAITSLDLKIIGVVNYNFTLSVASEFTENLALSPVFFIKSLKELPTPEIPPVVHKDYFVYSSLQLEPKLENVFSVGEAPDIFYFIYGCSANPAEPTKFNIEVVYNVKKGDENVIKFAPSVFEIPFISHQIPLQKEGGVNLEPGKYRLEIRIKDKISEKELVEYVDFEIV